MLVFTRTIRVPDANGVLTDADTLPTIGIVRTDTSAVVVAAGTPMVRDSLGKYSYSLSGEVAGVTYRASYVIVVNGSTTTSASELTAPTDSARPVTWAEAKAHLRLSTDTDQAYVESLIDAATDYAEERLHTTLMQRSRTDKFYDGKSAVTIPYGPLIAVTSVTDDDGKVITDYDISRVGVSDRLTINVGFTPPLTVTRTAGYASAADIPASIKLAILCHVATLYENRESVTEKGRAPVPHSLSDFYQLKSRSVGVA